MRHILSSIESCEKCACIVTHSSCPNEKSKEGIHDILVPPQHDHCFEGLRKQGKT